MKSSRIIAISATLLVLSFFAPTLRADEVENPAYKAWSSFKAGSTATIGGTLQAGAMSITIEIKTTLVDLTADQAVVEVTRTSVINGQSRTAPAQKQTIPAKAEKKEWKEVGTADVEAAGKTFKCKVIEGASPAAGPGTGPANAAGSAKIYFSGDVPGGIVKMEFSVAAPGAAGAGAATSFVLKSFEAK